MFMLDIDMHRASAQRERAIYQDLRKKLFIRPEELTRQYTASPAWLRKLMIAWADGLNFYLRTHPEVTPEPGAGETEPEGSNGIAIAPSNTANHHALLLINPHTSFFFRSELQVTSDDGLNAYGAVTWGQFFIYQGFNARLGWMHTSSGVDNVDFFLETIVNKNGLFYYRYGAELRPVTASTITVPYRGPGGASAVKTFTVYRTHHGPIIQQLDGKWVSIALMQKPIDALTQSFLLTKARDYASFEGLGAARQFVE